MSAHPFCDDEWIEVGTTRASRKERMRWRIFVGLDVSVRETSVCVVDDVGKYLGAESG